MNFLILSYAAFFFVLVIAILWERGTSVDIKNRRIKVINKENSSANVYGQLDESFADRFIKPLIGKATQAIDEASEKNRSKSANDKEKIAEIEKQLRLAGVAMSAADYQFLKTAVLSISSVVGIILALILPLDVMIRLLVVVAGVVLGYAGPDFVLKSKVSGHQEEIRMQLPDAMDLLGTCIEAGLSFDGALVKVSEKMEGPFIDELMILYHQIQMGKPRGEALKAMADSSEIQELKTFIAALAQAQELGIPINNVMSVQSKQLRETRKRVAQEKGLKAPVKMMIPLVGLIFPTILIIIMGPAVLNMMGML